MSPSYSATIAWAGWPVLALEWELWREVLVKRQPTGVVDVEVVEYRPPGQSFWRFGVPYPGPEAPVNWRWKRLPIQPVWPGFAINTVLYAILAAGLWYAPGVIRRNIRQRRGLCSACGYLRAGLPAGAACPECGVMP